MGRDRIIPGLAPTPEQVRGTFLGRPDPVSPGWGGYGRGTIERHAREVHYDVLRESGFDRDRAREISAESADGQARNLDRWAAESAPKSITKAAREPSGFDIRSVIAGLDDEPESEG